MSGVGAEEFLLNISRVHSKNSSAPTPDHTTSPGVLVLTTLNLVVYASLWMVQAHLCLP